MLDKQNDNFTSEAKLAEIRQSDAHWDPEYIPPTKRDDCWRRAQHRRELLTLLDKVTVERDAFAAAGRTADVIAVGTALQTVRDVANVEGFMHGVKAVIARFEAERELHKQETPTWHTLSYCIDEIRKISMTRSKGKSIPLLKCTVETINNVEVNDLEDFIKEVTGHGYECIPNQEWSNDSNHRFMIDGELDEHDRSNWEAFKRGEASNCNFILHAILTGLCADGHIQPGTYLVNVCW